MEADSIVPDPGSAVAFERYTYSLNNPIRYNDPSGYIPCSGDNWDDGPQCLNNPNSDLSSAVANRHYQEELVRSGEAAELVTFATVSIVAVGAAPAAIGAGLDLITAASTCLVTNCQESVWKLNPLARGRAIENILGRSPQLT